MSDALRGHTIFHDGIQWRYCDTGEPTAGNPRPCGACGKPDTPEGHDGCLGTLPGVMNACCGHGAESEAYVQYADRRIIRCAAARRAQAALKRIAGHGSRGQPVEVKA